jgi:hypothetical protein
LRTHPRLRGDCDFLVVGPTVKMGVSFVANASPPQRGLRHRNSAVRPRQPPSVANASPPQRGLRPARSWCGTPQAQPRVANASPPQRGLRPPHHDGEGQHADRRRCERIPASEGIATRNRRSWLAFQFCDRCERIPASEGIATRCRCSSRRRGSRWSCERIPASEGIATPRGSARGQRRAARLRTHPRLRGDCDISLLRSAMSWTKDVANASPPKRGLRLDTSVDAGPEGGHRCERIPASEGIATRPQTADRRPPLPGLLRTDPRLRGDIDQMKPDLGRAIQTDVANARSSEKVAPRSPAIDRKGRPRGAHRSHPPKTRPLRPSFATRDPGRRFAPAPAPATSQFPRSRYAPYVTRLATRKNGWSKRLLRSHCSPLHSTKARLPRLAATLSISGASRDWSGQCWCGLVGS